MKGARTPVLKMVRVAEKGDTVEDMPTEFPSLDQAGIMARLDDAAELAEEQEAPIPDAGRSRILVWSIACLAN